MSKPIKGSSSMRILSTQYTLATKSFEIYMAGCRGVDGQHCKNCHNPETWDFNQGEYFNSDYFNKNILTKIIDFNSLINNIMIFGGEPLDQPVDELINMLKMLYKCKKTIWLFTRNEIENVPDKIKEYCNYIKCGSYVPELTTENNIQYGIKLATSNQHIYKKGIDY